VRQQLSNWFRAKRDRLLRQVIAAAPRRGETLQLLDLGGRAYYWRRLGTDFLREHKVHVTLLNLTDLELYAGDEDPTLFTYLVGDACKLDLADNSFDLCHSNSVIEHVGLAWQMEAFAGEVRRIAPSHFVQSPNFWFPIDPHFWRLPLVHWTPRPLRAHLMRWLPLATAGRAPDMISAYRFADSSQMLSKAQMRALFPDSRLHAERFMLLAKSYTAVRLAK